ncbi:hypothetical protein LCGC14_1341830 [marine sediment metagenome]|uniref:Methyltransferase domain-containing protein n=1 Tax=marine sediment metagenome TaxID=412755 RepID=A0A0F9KDA4_9ZZZZ
MTKVDKKEKRDKPMGKTLFKLMRWEFKNRDKKYPPLDKIKKTKIKKGDSVLDYGCGPGGYTIAAAEFVGENGKVFAVDIHPLAIDSVKKKTLERGLKNIETILTNCNTNLPENSIDVVLLLDIFHDLSDPDTILKELHRILKNNGWLAVDDHHLKDNEIIDEITRTKLFEFDVNNGGVFNFRRLTTN